MILCSVKESVIRIWSMRPLHPKRGENIQGNTRAYLAQLQTGAVTSSTP